VYVFGAVVYGLLASGVTQKWAEVTTGYLPHTTAENSEPEH